MRTMQGRHRRPGARREPRRGNVGLLVTRIAAVLARLADASEPSSAHAVKAVSDVTIPFSAPPPSALSGKLHRPQGDGPFPAVVLMHTCVGPGPGPGKMALRLREAGYVALEVDSFGRRGVKTACGPEHPTPVDRVEDAFAARRYLSSLPFVDPQRIALVGWSHGGSAALWTWARNSDEARAASFAAIAAYYPMCFIDTDLYEDEDVASATAPLLILIGDRDEVTPTSLCRSFVDLARKLGRDASMAEFAGATHAFDEIEQPTEFQGHRQVPDPAAALAAGERLLRFLDGVLKTKR